MKFKIKFMSILAPLLALSAPATADDVLLTSKSGGLTVSGTLLAFDGDTYQVETDLGRITISDSDLTCQGRGCPSPKDRLDVFSLISTDRITRETLLAFLDAYAKDNQKLFTKKGPFSNPTSVELSHRTEGLESIVSFKSDVINLGFSANETGTPIGFDAVQIISSSSALKGRIDTETLRRIWDGSISNWNELGGADQPIRLILPIFAGDLFSTFARFDADLSAENVSPNVEYFLSPEAIIQAVSQSPDTIGLIYESQSSELTVALDLGCSITSAPSDFAIQSLEYPLSYQISMNSDNAFAPRTAKELQAYAQTLNAQTIFTKAGLIPLVGQQIESSYKGKRFADAIAAADKDVGLKALQSFAEFANTATRLATTLYFTPDGRELDDMSFKTLPALIAHLKLPEYSGRTILAVGFSDSQGGANANQTVSLSRARNIQSALGQEGVSVDAIGFGEVAPIGCNTSDYGRMKNRRVKIWVRD